MLSRTVTIADRTASSEALGSATLLDWTLEIAGAVDGGNVKLWLDPLHPFRKVEDVSACLANAERHGMAGTFAELSYHPSWMLHQNRDGTAAKLFSTGEAWNGGASSERVFRTAGTVAFTGALTTEPYSNGIAHVIVAEPMDARTPSRLRMCRALLRDPGFVASLDPVLQRLA